MVPVIPMVPMVPMVPMAVWDKYYFFWTNEYPNIFGTIDIGQMNIQIYSP